MAKEEKKIAVRVAARPERGFHRAGRFWPPTPTDAEVTAAELKVIEASADLVCVRYPPGASIPKAEEEIATATDAPPAGENAAPPPAPPPPTTPPAGSSKPEGGKGRGKTESGAAPQG